MPHSDDATVPEPGEDTLASPRQKSLSARRGSVERRVARAVGSALEGASWADCRRLGSMLGLAFFAVGRKRRERAIANVQLALGFNRALALRVARRSAQNWGMTTCEFMHLPGASAQQVHDYTQVGDDDLKYLRAALGEGSGVILLTAHLGNWEMIGARLAPEFAFSAIVRPLSSPTMQAAMSQVRLHSGMSLISKHVAARPALKALRRGEILCLLPDRHAGPDGLLLPLFGCATRFESAPARLAAMSGAPIVPLFGVRREPWLSDGRIQLRMGTPFQVEFSRREDREAAVIEGTKQVIASIESMVRASPDQWSWMLRRWRECDALDASAPLGT